jgi:hypothetical protein
LQNENRLHGLGGGRVSCERSARRAWSIAAGAWLFIALAVPAHAQGENGALTAEELIRRIERQDRVLAEQKRRIEEQEKTLREYRKALEQMLAREKLQRQELDARRGGRGISAGAAPAQSDKPLPAQASKGASDGAVVAESQTQEAVPTPDAPAGQPPESATRPPEVAPLSELQSVLTPQGKLVLEPSLEFSTSSSDRVALIGFTIIPGITIGLIDVRRVKREFVSPAITARYGLTRRAEIEVKVPYVFRWESTTARPLAQTAAADQVFDVDGNGLGDVELSARYQLNAGGPSKPFFIGSLRFKTTTGKGPFEVDTFEPIADLTIPTELPTGTGFYALQPGITALFPSDPAVFFSTLTYTWNIEKSVDRDVSGNFIGDFDPGDSVGVTFGMGLALNERASFSVGYEHNLFFEDKVNGQKLPLGQDIHIGRLLFGYSYQIAQHTNFNLSLGVGVTDESPDVNLTLRMPVTF